MPRGVYQRKEAAAGGSVMTKEEIAEAEARIEGKVSPLPAPKGAAVETITAPDGFQRKRVGNFSKPAELGDSSTLKHFAHTEPDYEADGWIEMTPEMALKYEEERRLIGYNSDRGLGLISKKPSLIPKKRTP